MAVPVFKSFVSEKEIEDVKKKRQEEWERVRKPDDPLERPEVEYDSRTLYAKLKEQKDKKDDEYAEQFKFKNMIYKGLDEDESGFLSFIASRQADHDANVVRSEIEEISAYRESVARLQEEALLSHTVRESPATIDSEEKNSTPTSVLNDRKKANLKLAATASKSQLAIIAGSIKTKRKRCSTEEGDTSDRNEKSTPDKKLKISTSTIPNRTAQSPQPGSSLALSGLAAYSSSDESDEG